MVEVAGSVEVVEELKGEQVQGQGPVQGPESGQGQEIGQVQAKIRDRVVALRRIRARDIEPHPRNARLHPRRQQRAVRRMLERLGYVDACLARQLPDGRYQMLDGHLRRDLTPDNEVPVLIVDLDDGEAAEMLATLDRTTEMAEWDEGMLVALCGQAKFGADDSRDLYDKGFLKRLVEAGVLRQGDELKRENGPQRRVEDADLVSAGAGEGVGEGVGAGGAGAGEGVGVSAGGGSWREAWEGGAGGAGAGVEGSAGVEGTAGGVEGFAGVGEEEGSGRVGIPAGLEQSCSEGFRPRDLDDPSQFVLETVSPIAITSEAIFASSNKWGIPDLLVEELAGEESIPDRVWHNVPVDPSDEAPNAGSLMTYGNFPKKVNCKGAVLCFYIDDKSFVEIWDKPGEMTMEMLGQGWRAVMVPDFSIFMKDPLILQLWDVYKARWCARYWQECGLKVLPHITWTDERTWDVSFSTIPRGAPVIATQCRSQGGSRHVRWNCEQNKKERWWFFEGLRRGIEVIQPKHVLLYGGAEHYTWLKDEVPTGPEYHYYFSFRTLISNARDGQLDKYLHKPGVHQSDLQVRA